MADNRRSSTRHAVSIAAKLAIGESPGADCTILNLSLGGALISAPQRYTMGQRTHLTFKLDTAEAPIDVGATVRWADDTSVGIQFDGLRARDVWALNEYFKQLAP